MVCVSSAERGAWPTPRGFAGTDGVREPRFAIVSGLHLGYREDPFGSRLVRKVRVDGAVADRDVSPAFAVAQDTRAYATPTSPWIPRAGCGSWSTAFCRQTVMPRPSAIRCVA